MSFKQQPDKRKSGWFLLQLSSGGADGLTSAETLRLESGWGLRDSTRASVVESQGQMGMWAEGPGVGWELGSLGPSAQGAFKAGQFPTTKPCLLRYHPLCNLVYLSAYLLLVSHLV